MGYDHPHGDGPLAHFPLNFANLKAYMQMPVVPDSILHVIPQITKTLFYWLILTVSVFALIANSLAVRSIVKRKWKFLKKTCLISLAIADVFAVLIFAMNNLEILSNTEMIWTLGESLCYFIPMGQVLGTTASSLALLIIALDRYQNVNKGKSWNYQPYICISAAAVLFLACAVLSYPMFTFYDYKAVNLQKGDTIQLAHMCITVMKERISVYYLVMAVLIFFPIMVVFVWFYYSIAIIVWKHRKPVSASYIIRPEVELTSSTGNSTNYSQNVSQAMKKKKNVQLEKKIRTFKIVIVIMVCFVVCRLPYWVFFALKLSIKMEGPVAWNLNFTFLVLNLINCALDPLLYTFLNETIKTLKIFGDFVSKVFCCCFSNDDFEDFEKNNPFEGYSSKTKVESKKLTLKANCQVTFLDGTTPVDSNYLQKY